MIKKQKLIFLLFCCLGIGKSQVEEFSKHVDLQVAEFSVVPLQQKVFVSRMEYMENTLSKSNDQVCILSDHKFTLCRKTVFQVSWDNFVWITALTKIRENMNSYFQTL